MGKYRHIFFDLDRTLWDLDRNANEALSDIYVKYDLQGRGIPDVDEFVKHYDKYNELLWDRYRRKLIDKNTLRALRFKQVLAHFGVKDESLSKNVEQDFIFEAPRRKHLVPGAKELLDHLSADYKLHIITNGFPETQAYKMEHSGLTPYFDVIVTSEGVGHPKPDRKIFDYSLRMAKATKEESVMIGDDLAVDIVGAREAGWAQIFFNPQGGTHNEEVMHEVKHLAEIASLV